MRRRQRLNVTAQNVRAKMVRAFEIGPRSGTSPRRGTYPRCESYIHVYIHENLFRVIKKR